MSAFKVKKTLLQPVNNPPPKKEQTLAVSGGPNRQVGADMRTSLLKDSNKRITSTVTKENLELLYRIDGLTFRIVQKYKEKMLGKGYMIKEGTEEARKLCTKFCESVYLIRVLDQIINDIFVTGNGNAWTELGYSKDGTNILKLRTVNPKSGIDYIRSPEADILYDKNIDPIGYEMAGQYGYPTMKWTEHSISAGQEIIWRPTSETDDGRDRIAHWTLINNGENGDGISPLEPTYKACMIRMNLEDTIGNAAFRSLGLAAYVGSATEDPMTISDEQLDDVKNKLQSVDQDTVWAFRRNVQLSAFPIPDIQNYERLLYYMADLHASCAGIPIGLILEPASSATKGDIEVKESEFMDSVVDFQDILAVQVRENIFKRILKANGKPEDSAPYIKFNVKETSMALSTARRLSTYARYNLLTPSTDLEAWIREQESLPMITSENEDEIKKIKADKMKPPVKTALPTANMQKTVNKKSPPKGDEEDPVK